MNSFLTNPLIAFIRKNFVAVFFLVASVFLALSEAAFGFVGQLAYVPALIIAVLLGARIIRRLASGPTTCAYTDQLVTHVKVWNTAVNGYVDKEVGNFVTDFHNLPPATKVWITVVQRGVELLVVAIIIQHLWK